MRKGSSSRDNFQLEIPPGGKIPWTKLPNRGWFAVYDRAPNGYSDASRLFTAEGLDGLRRWYRRTAKDKTIENRFVVHVQTATSEGDLMDPATERLVWDITQKIERLKSWGKKDALLRVRASLERKGTVTGPKRRDYADWKIETLRNLVS